MSICLREVKWQRVILIGLQRKQGQILTLERGGKMPKKVEEKLKRQAKKKGLSKKRTGAYVYGTMQKQGMMGDMNRAMKKYT